MIAIIDCRATSSVRMGLQKHGLELLEIPPHPDLPPPVASHPDMLIFFAKDTILTTKKYAEIAKKELNFLSSICQKPIHTIRAAVGNQYPKDILLNVAPIGRFLFAHPSALEQEHFLQESYLPCPVRQGYAKCSVIPVGDAAMITSDPSIAKCAKEIGLDLLYVSPTPIHLPGYDTGFLGGAASFAPYGGTEEIFFCGDLEAHPDAIKIRDFLAKHQRKAISLCRDPLIDLGTVFIIK